MFAPTKELKLPKVKDVLCLYGENSFNVVFEFRSKIAKLDNVELLYAAPKTIVSSGRGDA